MATTDAKISWKYDHDLADFYGKIVGDADVHETTRDLESAPGKFRYMKEKTWTAPRARKEDAYGVWIEIIELWREEKYRYVMADGLIQQKIVTIYHTDIEYYSYGNVDNSINSRYLHETREVEA